MRRIWYRRYWKILDSMGDIDHTMTIEMITNAAKQPRARVLRFRDWALQHNHISSEKRPSLDGKGIDLYYTPTPPPNKLH